MRITDKSFEQLLTVLESSFGDVLGNMWDNFPDAADEGLQNELEKFLNQDEEDHKAAIKELRRRLANAKTSMQNLNAILEGKANGT